MRVAVATALAARGLDPDEPLLLEALARAGATAEVVAWNGEEDAWERFDLVVLRSTWDYPQQYGEFLAWVDRVGCETLLLNPPPTVRANTDKRYLARLADAGVPTVPTTFHAPGEPPALPASGPFVVKPSVSAGARDTIRCRPGERDRAVALSEQLHAQGRTVMVQPYIPSVDARGETAMVFFDGTWSHAVRKGPMLAEGAEPTASLYGPERLKPSAATADEHAVAAAALRALGADDLLYARVDLVGGDGDERLVLEVELTEPSLFLSEVAGTADRFARAIVARVA